jgi:hypothetical protein|tara:strand:+ start:12938 stop:13588 length:651 start_codon:yes stop_codon:yes gene_type:complete
MGVEDNQYQIPNLNANTSFFDWYTKENDAVIAKLNKLKLYDIDIPGSLAQGISAQRGSSGGQTSGFVGFAIAGSIPHGITLQGNLVVTGDNLFTVEHKTASVTAGITTNKFVCFDQSGGITLSNGATSGITTSPFHKNESIGVVHSIVGNTITIAGSGKYSGFTGLTVGQAYYLDPTTLGGYTTNAPSNSGETKKRLFLSTGTAEAIIQIGDSDIV